MNKLYNLIFSNRIKKQKETLFLLDEFIKNIYFGEDLTLKESKKNLEEGLIEIIYNNGVHHSNGLLITENGYFLTAKHCVESDLSSLKIKLYNGEVYPIKESYFYFKTNEDIAIAKADIPRKGNYNIKKYKIFNTNNTSNFNKIPIALLTRLNNKINISYGFINKWDVSKVKLLDGDSFVNQFSLDILAKNGDSGGIFTSSDGRLIGIESTGNENNFATGVKILDALELVYYYKNKIQKIR